MDSAQALTVAQAEELLVFPGRCSVSSDGCSVLDAHSKAVIQPVGCSELSIEVGELLQLTAILRRGDGTYQLISQGDGNDVHLQVVSSDYSLFVCASRRLEILGCEANENPVELRVAYRSGKLAVFNCGRALRAVVKVYVKVGYRFVVFAENHIQGALMAVLKYGRDNLKGSWWSRWPCQFQYLVEAGELTLEPGQKIQRLAWATSSALHSGWTPCAVSQITTSNPKHAECSEFEQDKFFTVRAGEKLRKNATVKVVDAQDNEHSLVVHVRPNDGTPFSLGLSQTPRFRDRRGQKRKNIFRRFSVVVFQILAVVMIVGGLLAQMRLRGSVDGALYTVTLIAEGMALIVGMSLLTFLLIALFTYISRKARMS